MGVVTEREQKQQAANTGWTSIEAGVVDKINAATVALESLSPRAKMIARRGFFLMAAGTTAAVVLGEYQRRNNAAYQKELKGALAARGVADVFIASAGEMTDLQEGKIEKVVHTSGRTISFVNLSKYEILYDKRAMDRFFPYAEAYSNVVLFRSGVVPPIVFWPDGTNSMEREFSGLASRQRVSVLPNSGYHQANIDDVVKLVRGSVDLSDLYEIEREALGIRVGIDLSSGFVATMRYLGFNSKVNRGVIPRNSVEYLKTVEERDSFEHQLFELIRTGQLRPIFRVVFK